MRDIQKRKETIVCKLNAIDWLILCNNFIHSLSFFSFFVKTNKKESGKKRTQQNTENNFEKFFLLPFIGFLLLD